MTDYMYYCTYIFTCGCLQFEEDRDKEWILVHVGYKWLEETFNQLVALLGEGCVYTNKTVGLFYSREDKYSG